MPAGFSPRRHAAVALVGTVAVACSLRWDEVDPRGNQTGGPAVTSTSRSSSGAGTSDGGGGRAAQATVGAGGGGSNAGGGGGDGGGGGGASNGCADGTRELFVDISQEPNIAGCSGAWSVEGFLSGASMVPQCGRNGGNDGVNPDGTGCSAEDLCAAGWAVCASATEVAAAAANGGCPPAGPPGMWATRQGGLPASKECSSDGIDDVAGCGYVIGRVPGATCAPLNRVLHHVDCTLSTGWDCGSEANFLSSEHTIVTKPTTSDGGVLCCRR
ncbi:MAG: hypothetical protein AAGN82_06600 [Myxococcota bacterium]